MPIHFFFVDLATALNNFKMTPPTMGKVVCSLTALPLLLFIILALQLGSSQAYLMELVVEPVFEFSKSGFFSLVDWTSSVSRFNSLLVLLTNPTAFFLSVHWDRIFNFIFWSLSVVFTIFTIRRLKMFFMDPINRVRLLGDVGYHNEVGSGDLDSGVSSCAKKDALVAAVRKRRKTGDIPPVYPNGWFAILESKDLKPGDAKSISCLGESSRFVRILPRSICPSNNIFIHSFVHLLINPSIHPSIHPSTNPSIHPPIHPPYALTQSTVNVN